MDSLNNRIQANPNSYPSAAFRNAIDIIQDLSQRLGPAIEESELLHTLPAPNGNLQEPNAPSLNVDEPDILGQPESSLSSGGGEIVSSDENLNIDPRILLWNSREQIHRMQYPETGQHMSNQPQNETWMHTGPSEENSPGTFRRSDELFGDSGEE